MCAVHTHLACVCEALDFRIASWRVSPDWQTDWLTDGRLAASVRLRRETTALSEWQRWHWHHTEPSVCAVTHIGAVYNPDHSTCLSLPTAHTHTHRVDEDFTMQLQWEVKSRTQTKIYSTNSWRDAAWQDTSAGNHCLPVSDTRNQHFYGFLRLHQWAGVLSRWI